MKKEINAIEVDQSKALAREIVKNRLPKKLDGNGIGADSRKYVHIVATNTDQLTLDVVRQSVLLCHFPNFHDDEGKLRTQVTILVPQADEAGLKKLEKRLTGADCFGNLLKYCIHTVRMENGEDVSEYKVTGSYLDVEVTVIGLEGRNADDFLKERFVCGEDAIVTIFAAKGDLDQQTEKELAEKYHQLYILPDRTAEKLLPFADVLPQAKLVNMIYDASKYISEIYLKDLTNVAAYTPAMKTFLFHTPDYKVQKKWDRLKTDVILELSNYYVVDAFEYKLHSIGCDVTTPKKEMQQAVYDNILDLSRAEHARWNVEKLLLGFRPLSDAERYEDEMAFGKAQEAFRCQLKEKHYVHINICSYNTLCRIDHNALKYDVFLMLAMPEVIYKEGCFRQFINSIKRICSRSKDK